MFYGCESLSTVPPLDTTNVTTMTYMFYNSKNLKSLPAFNAVNVKNITSFFSYSAVTTLTDFGGLIGLKIKWNDTNCLNKVPNLTYESCINVLNGLYDFTGNGQTPSSSQGVLKVHANFLTTVGDELAIGTNKGWKITA
jgi:surface protein